MAHRPASLGTTPRRRSVAQITSPGSRGISEVQEKFVSSTELYRPQVHAHCYRMMGSVHEADDLTQETYLRAWRHFDRFAGRSSVRTWLYTISTRVCLDALAKRRTRARWLPDQRGASTDKMPLGQPDHEAPWLEPYPSSELERVRDPRLDPGDEAVFRETLRLAFVAAVQRLPPRQRAVLLLDSLRFTAPEMSGVLKLSEAAVNSALQRARTTMRNQTDADDLSSNLSPEDDAIVSRYVAAWESGDLEAVLALLAEEVRFVMPPWIQWYLGRRAVEEFLSWAFDWAWATRDAQAFRFRRVSANGAVGLAAYVRPRGAADYHLHAVQLLSIRHGVVQRLHVFLSKSELNRFEVPQVLPLGE
jgi:RNA polymerase sigma-70 factor, ECF subfamily